MTSKRESIMTYVVNAIETGATLATGGIFYERPESVARAETPCILISKINDSINEANVTYMDRRLSFKVTIVTRGLQPVAAADPIAIQVYDALMVDRSLGGIILELFPAGDNFTVQDGDQPIGILDMLFTARYRHLATGLDD